MQCIQFRVEQNNEDSELKIRTQNEQKKEEESKQNRTNPLSFLPIHKIPIDQFTSIIGVVED